MANDEILDLAIAFFRHQGIKAARFIVLPLLR